MMAVMNEKSRRNSDRGSILRHEVRLDDETRGGDEGVEVGMEMQDGEQEQAAEVVGHIVEKSGLIIDEIDDDAGAGAELGAGEVEVQEVAQHGVPLGTSDGDDSTEGKVGDVGDRCAEGFKRFCGERDSTRKQSTLGLSCAWGG